VIPGIPKKPSGPRSFPLRHTVSDGDSQEYADTAAELVKLRREAKLNGNFFVEPEVTRNLNAIDMEVSYVMGVPLLVNGFFHGKSY